MRSDFTSFIGAELTGSSIQEMLRLEKAVDKTFDSIERRAAAASRATAGLVGGGRSTAGANASIIQAQRTGQANSAIVRSSQVAQRQIQAQAMATGHLERSNAAMVQGLRSTATALQVVQGPLGPMAGRITALSNAFERLTGFRLGIAAVGASLFALTSAANKAAEIRSKLSPLYETQTQVNNAFAKTAQIAKDTRSSLEPVVDLFSRLTLVSRDFNIPDIRVEKSVRAAALGARISGGSQQAQQAAITQLSQGIGSNRLGGEELKSIAEQAPRIARAIADGLSNTEEFGKVTVGMLRDLGAEGELTADRVTRALGRSLKQLEEEAKRLGPTLASSTSAFGTEFTLAVGNLDRALGLTTSIATAIQFAADNMREFVALIAGAATGWAAVRILPMLPKKIDEFGQFIGRQQESVRIARQAADADVKATSAALAGLSKRNESLKQQRTYIEANVAALEKEVRTRQNRVNNIAPQAALGAGVAPTSIIREAAEETEKLKNAQERLGRQYSILNGIQVQQADTTRNLNQKTDAHAAAMGRAAKVGSAFRNIGANILAVLNPWAIGVGLLSMAIFELATAESAAERNAKKLDEIQRKLADTVDETTGRIREQNKELRRGYALENSRGYAIAKDQFETSGRALGREALEKLQVGTRSATAEERARGGKGSQATYLGGAGGREATQLLANLAAGRGDILAIGRRLDELARLNPKVKALRDAADTVTSAQSDLVDKYREVQKRRAYAADLNGTATENDRRILRGDFSGGRVDGKPVGELNKSAEQLRKQLADPKFRANRTMTESLKELDVKRGQMSEKEYVKQRADILATYDREMQQIAKTGQAAARRDESAAERARDRKQQLDDLMASYQDDAPVKELERILDGAEKAKGKIRDLIGEQVEGIGKFGAADAEARIEAIEASVGRRSAKFLEDTMDRFQDDTPIRRLRELSKEARDAKTNIDALIGRKVDGRVFTADDAAAQKGKIDAYVQAETRRPFNDNTKQFSQEMQLQQLRLQGRDAEAAAMEKMFSLQENMTDLTQADYQVLVNQAQQQERINDLLGYRQKLIDNLQSSVESFDSALEEALTKLAGGRPDKAVKSFFQSLSQDFGRIQIRDLTTRLTAGLDTKMRDFLNGKNQIDVAISGAASSMTNAGTAAERLAADFEAAAERVRNSALETAAGTNAIAGAPAKAVGKVVEAVSQPFGSGSISSRFGTRRDPFTGALKTHAGIDFAQPMGTSVGATAGGTVSFAGQRGGYGNMVVLDHGNGVQTFYAHLSKITTTLGSIVKQGELVGRVGSTGRSTGSHLHYEVRQDGVAINPARFAQNETIGQAIGQTGGVASTQQQAQAIGGAVASAIEIGGFKIDMSGADRTPATMDDPDRRIGPTYIDGGTQQGSKFKVTRTEAAYNQLGAEFGKKLDGIFGNKNGGGFAEQIGSKLGTVLQGAQNGQMASGIAKMLGIKQSATGAAIGGGIGQAVGGPIGGFVGGLIGGTIGGLFKKTKKSSATVSLGEFGDFVTGGVSGSDAQRRGAAKSLGGGVGSTLSDIAAALGGKLTGAGGSLSIGTRKDKFIVDPSGRGRTKGSGTQSYASEQEAIEAATRVMIERGVIGGISKASQTILASGRDLQSAIQKAAQIESIPRRLLALKDPVRSAVTELNREFADLINALREGGATAEQYSQAEELYQLERVKAIEAANQQASSAIQSFLDQMNGSSQSPLNRKTVYSNAREQVDRFTSDINAGKVVDESKLLEAASNFQDASRQLNGSSENFFADFQFLQDLLTKAKGNFDGSKPGESTAPLPDSPFAGDSGIMAMIEAYRGTAQGQTDVLNGTLQEILTAIQGGNSGSGTDVGGSAIDILPAFGTGSYGGRVLNNNLRVQ